LGLIGLCDGQLTQEVAIQHDEVKVWLTPLLEVRNALDKPDDRDRRDGCRMSGRVQRMAGGSTVIAGPYTKEWREHWLRRVLEAQQSARQEGPAEFRNLQLISLDELQAIRRIWLYDKHEFGERFLRHLQPLAQLPDVLGPPARAPWPIGTPAQAVAITA
jgi:DNA sulfur modification protein DndC